MIEHSGDNETVDARRLHSDLLLTNQQLKAQQVTLDHILAKLGSMEVAFQAFTTSKAVLDERLAHDRRRIDELEKTVADLSKAYEAAKAQGRLVWIFIGGPVGALVLSAFRDVLGIGK